MKDPRIGSLDSSIIICALVPALGACAAVADEGDLSATLGEEGGLAAEEDGLADALVSFANTAAPEELGTVVDSRARDEIVAARPLAGVGALAAVPYVGDATLEALLAHVAPEASAAGAGFWEERLLGAQQAAAVLEMANVLELATLGCDVGLSATMADRVIAARPFATLDAVVDVPYFGASHLARFEAAFGWWEGGVSAATLDCVSFTTEQLEAGLRFVNEAGWSQFCAMGGCGFGGWSAAVEDLVAGRPWASLADVSAMYGMGPARMAAVRRGSDEVLAGLVLGADTVRGVVAGGAIDEHVDLGLVTVLASVPAPYVYVPGTGIRFTQDCVSIADADDSTPDAPGHSALLCEGFGYFCEPRPAPWLVGTSFDPGEMRWFLDPSFGVIFYVAQTSCAY